MTQLRKKQVIAVLGLVAITIIQFGQAHAAAVSLVPHRAEYKLKISVLGGRMSTVVEETEKGFAANSVIKPTGFARVIMKGTIEESSEFTAGSDGMRPLIYNSSDTLSKKDKFMNFEFDWPQQLVSGKINNEDFSFELTDDVHDRVSIQYELMHNLLNGKASGDYAMLDGDKLKQLQVTNIGTRKIKTPFGTYEAIGIQHTTKNSSRVSTLWCAEELGYLPVLIEQHRNGKRRVRAILTDYVATNPVAPVASH